MILQIPALADCPICGAKPRRVRKKKVMGVVCYAGSHRLEAIGDDTLDAARIWNDIADDWQARQSGPAQIDQAFGLIEKIAAMHHIAAAVDNGLNTHAAQLRAIARTFSAALAAKPIAGMDAGEVEDA